MNPIVRLLKKSTQNYVKDRDHLIYASDKSREGLIVPELIFRYGKLSNHVRKFPRIVRWLIPAVFRRMNGYWSLKKNPGLPKNVTDEDFLQELGEYIKSIGCNHYGFIEVPREYILRDKSILYTHAIVLTEDMNKDKMRHAPYIQAGQEVWRVYNSLGGRSNKIAGFLRKNGYAAQAGAALGGDSNYPLLGQLAGLGWIGKHGLLISPDCGPSQRLAVVYTSITNLPSPKENTFFWLEDFCNKCNLCVKKCPGGAIYRDKPILGDGKPIYIDYKKCIIPFTESMGCSVCIKVCPFFKIPFKPE